MYGDVVMGVQKRADEDHEPFEMVIHELQARAAITPTSRTPKLTADDQKELVKRFKALVKERTGKEFPQRSVEAAPGRRPAPCSAPG